MRSPVSPAPKHLATRGIGSSVVCLFAASRAAIAPAVAILLAIATPLACREPSDEVLGADLYARYCASCHGEIAPTGAIAGRQPDAPDLTRLAARFGSPLRRDELASFIDGRRELRAHGTREMPAWGEQLYRGYPETPGTETVRKGTLELIIDFLESQQRGAAAAVSAQEKGGRT
jgi:hypothetical protein